MKRICLRDNRLFGFAILLVCFAVFSASTATAQQDNLTIGLETQRPKEGKFVEIKNGFMVAYEATIPGTKAKYTMVPIPGGTFTMGSPATEKDRSKDEGPQFAVTVEPFWMSKFETTWAEYRSFMDLDDSFRRLHKMGLRITQPGKNLDSVTAPSALYDPSYTFDVGEGNDEPAATMTHYSAMQYSKWLSLTSERFYRLPTEAEWEYACRAGTTTAFYFGDDPSDLEKHAWFDNDDNLIRHPVGKKLPNPFGLYDMHGNVAEWVLDGYDADGYRKVETGKPITSLRAYAEPDPQKKHPRIARGGSFDSIAKDCRSASRKVSSREWALEDPNVPRSPWWYTDSPASGTGFRLIRPLNPPKTLDQKNKFWVTDLKSFEEAKERYKFNGRGANAPVDPELPKDIKRLNEN